MDVLAWVAMGVAVLAGAFTFLYVWTAVGSRVQHTPDERHSVLTDDGHTLPLYRHKPPAAYGPPRGAVVCLHGLGANHFNLDFPGPANLARWLADAGYDVFVPGMRGDVDAVSPGTPAHLLTFDATVERDLKAVVHHVKQHSGFEQLHLVGHSMGGLLAYAYAVVHGEADLASITAIGSPVGFAEREAVVGNIKLLEMLVGRLAWLPVRFLGRLVVPFLSFVMDTDHIRRQLNADNTDLTLISRAMWHSLSNIPAGLAKQFSDWIRHDAFRSADHGRDYREGMRGITVPVCILAGSADELARPANALRAETLVSSPYKVVAVLGPDEGCINHYGHIDLIFGIHAPQEVFPRVAQFLHDASDGTLGITSRDVGLA